MHGVTMNFIEVNVVFLVKSFDTPKFGVRIFSVDGKMLSINHRLSIYFSA